MSKVALELLENLRTTARARREPHQPPPSTFAQRAADAVAAAVGSWRFVLIQSTLLIGWLLFNSLSGAGIDPYPFILLS